MTDASPVPLRDAGYLEWFVLDIETHQGKNILLNSNCLIEPYYEPVPFEVEFVVEDEEVSGEA